MLKRLNLSTLALACSIVLLTGCGGGSSDSSSTNTPDTSGVVDDSTDADDSTDTDDDAGAETATPKDFTVNYEQGKLIIPDNSSKDFFITFDGAEGDVSLLNLTSSTNAETFDYTFKDLTSDGVTISIVVRNEDSPKSGSIDLSYVDGDSREVFVFIEYDIENTSGVSILADYNTATQTITEFLELTQERELYKRVRQVALMMGADVSSEDDEINSLISDDLISDLESIKLYSFDNVSAYSVGEMSESELKEETDELLTQLSNYAAPINNIITNVISLTGGVVPDVELGTVYIDAQSNTVSQLVGNESLGSYDSDTWAFSNTYQFLSVVANPELETCSAE